jgi:hypothetical protein
MERDPLDQYVPLSRDSPNSFVLSLSLPEIDGEIVVLSNPTIRALISSIVITLIAAAVIWVGWKYNQDSRSLARCLLALEKHRSRFKSLPDCITLEKLVQSKPDELEKFLKDNEPKVRPQT